MKKIFVVLICFLLMSCFIEPKKTHEKKDTLNIEKTSDINENISLTTSSNKDEKINSSDLKENLNVDSKHLPNDLDRIYLGTNLFHEGSGGTWGKSIITKKANYYWIKGEHKMSDGDWIKIDGKITNPSIESFTFDGTIITYSPSTAVWLNKTNYQRKDNKIHKDTCVWVGKTVANKLFEDRKYWRIKSYDCYNYGHDIDIFHN